ncbi:uncharacterized protein SRS1_12217 [Sporisorium reilianum f. sp. reilianum]|uniref:Uncharacterized protein n=1 Tax=Sporisorium reilianum f. sp. reilianum TaxID=72559 RepID=A0A2N8U9L6_9BASI|nr:uncharacterized protein SRS1_12217 [Sporisorium reilianum f. sp. reilianum]
MASSPATTDASPASPSNKRKHRATALLSNHSDCEDKDAVQKSKMQADDGDTSTIAGTDGEDERTVKQERPTMFDGINEMIIPTSNVRSTSGATADDMDTDDDDVALSAVKGRRPRKTLKKDAGEDAKPFKSEPSTPKKAAPRTNAVAGSSKDVMTTSPKKQAASAPNTPNSKSGEPASVSTQCCSADCQNEKLIMLFVSALSALRCGYRLGLPLIGTTSTLPSSRSSTIT